ncbi:MAG TPA: hypothetical protein VGC03_01895 [Acidimicrobiia bacterium]|jgi:hypothetical protein
MTGEIHPPNKLTRFQYAAPHIGALLAFVPALIGGGVLGLGYFHPIVGIVASVLVAGCSFLGAKGVMALQGRSGDWRGPTLYPYVWWGGAALLCFLVGTLVLFVVYPGVAASNEEWAAVSDWQTAAGVLQLAGWAIVFFVPLLRFTMWLIRPPLSAM